MTWSKRHATVSGPTPPTTGVMAARSVRAYRSGERSPLSTPPSLAVPASTRVVPGEINSLDINPGTPVALMIISKSLRFVKSSPR